MSKKSWVVMAVTFSALALAVLFRVDVPLSLSVYSETLLSNENAYNPIPSRDGSKIAYVRTGRGPGSLGRSSLISEIAVMSASGKILTKDPLAFAFLSGWTSDSANLVAYRDWNCFLVSPEGTVSQQTRIPEKNQNDASYNHTERATYLLSYNAMTWVQNCGTYAVIRTAHREIARKSGTLGTMLVPSPDERYLALIDAESAECCRICVYDTKSNSWSDLGTATIHPQGYGWDWRKPSWNPWFADSSRLAFISNGLIVCSPDGHRWEQIASLDDPAGLAVPSPDGKLIAYATFKGRRSKWNEYQTDWADARIWVVPVDSSCSPVAVSRYVTDTTYSLRWLNNAELVFDRFNDALFPEARIWKTSLTANAVKRLSSGHTQP